MVGVRKDIPGAEEGFQGLEPLPTKLCLSLEEILDPREEGNDAMMLPAGQVAAKNVMKAKDEAERRGLEGDWMVNQQVGRG